ncbi:hypothetical protein [Pelagibius sp.]|uniref:hypothetical protein n=1 Tax=Pelagibius sp. TaxID=1931238 RepID=UPI00262C40DE|nr:hypothetical protein [Pelagibius sp.]
MTETTALRMASRGLLSAALAAAFCGAVVFASGTAPRAADLAKPVGPVVLTVAGDIGAANRPAFDEGTDSFLNYHEKTFQSAAEFDRAMLESLGMQRVEIAYEGWAQPSTFEGPWLKDVLAAAGAAGKDVTVVALDGFGAEIPAADIQALDWVVGLKRDGRYLGLGQRGPIWLVYRRPDGAVLTAEDEQRWPWAAFYIEVE